MPLSFRPLPHSGWQRVIFLPPGKISRDTMRSRFIAQQDRSAPLDSEALSDRGCF